MSDDINNKDSYLRIFANFDLASYIYSKYKKIPNDYKFGFRFVFVVNAVVFSYITIHFPQSNHEWDKFLWSPLSYQIAVGRWFCYVINALTGFMRLPILSYLLAIAAQTAAGLIAFHLFFREVKRLPLICFAVFITLIPYVCTYYHYTTLTPIFTFSNLFAVLSVLFAADSYNSKKSYFGAVLFSCFSLATYNTSLNVIATLFSLYILTSWTREIFQNDYRPITFIRRVICKFSSILFGLLLYYLSINILALYGVLHKQAYQMQIIDVSDIPTRILQVLYNAFLILLSSQEFITIYVRYALLTLLIIALIIVVTRPFGSNLSCLSKWIHFIIFFLLFLFTICMTKALFFASAYNGFHHYRMQGGLIFLYAFSIGTVLLAKLPFVRSISLVLVSFCVLSFIHSDLAYQALEVEQNKHAYAIGFELAKRVQALNNFNPHKRYRYVQLGYFPMVKLEMYSNNILYNKQPDLTAGDQIFGRIQLPAKGRLLKHIMPNIKLIITRMENINKLEKNILLEIIHYSETHQPWPAEGSVTILADNVIYVYIDPKLIPGIKEAVNSR